MGVIGWGLQIAYKPEDHPVVLAAAKWLVWIGVALLLFWAYHWLRERLRKPTIHQGEAHIVGSVTASADAVVFKPTVIRHDWRAGATIALGPAMPDRPDLQGLQIFLTHHSGAIPDGNYLCEIEIDGQRADARFNSIGRTQLSVIYPQEFTGGAMIPLPLRPGTHAAAWREDHGATAAFLVGLSIEVAGGKVKATEVPDDPMKG